MKHKNLLSHIKMAKEIITLVILKNQKYKFHRYKSPIFLVLFFLLIFPSYGDEATGFHDKEMPNVSSYCTFLAVINIDAALKKI